MSSPAGKSAHSNKKGASSLNCGLPWYRNLRHIGLRKPKFGLPVAFFGTFGIEPSFEKLGSMHKCLKTDFFAPKGSPKQPKRTNRALGVPRVV